MDVAPGSGLSDSTRAGTMSVLYSSWFEEITHAHGVLSEKGPQQQAVFTNLGNQAHPGAVLGTGKHTTV